VQVRAGLTLGVLDALESAIESQSHRRMLAGADQPDACMWFAPPAPCPRLRPAGMQTARRAPAGRFTAWRALRGPRKGRGESRAVEGAQPPSPAAGGLCQHS
jgi:hypothetical protein